MTSDKHDQRDSFVQKWIEKQESLSKSADISVVVPAYNEERRLPPTLIDMIDYFDGKQIAYEIIVVDDGSRDSTSEIIEKFVRIRPQVRLIRLPKNYGKGHGVRTGVLNARGRRILFADADGSTPIGEVERLHKAIDDGADMACGSRAMSSSETEVRTVWYRKIIGRTFNLLVNSFLLPEVADTQCGFKLFKSLPAKFLFEAQESDGFSFDLELFFIARQVGLKIEEVAVNWTNIPGSKVNLVLDSVRMFRDIFIFRMRHSRLGKQDYDDFLKRHESALKQSLRSQSLEKDSSIS